MRSHPAHRLIADTHAAVTSEDVRSPDTRSLSRDSQHSYTTALVRIKSCKLQVLSSS